jgi:hypothetical protein
MIQGGAMVDQPFDHFGMAFSSRKHQRRLTKSITRIDIGSARQQALKLIDGSAAYGVFPLTLHASSPSLPWPEIG